MENYFQFYRNSKIIRRSATPFPCHRQEHCFLSLNCASIVLFIFTVGHQVQSKNCIPFNVMIMGHCSGIHHKWQLFILCCFDFSFAVAIFVLIAIVSYTFFPCFFPRISLSFHQSHTAAVKRHITNLKCELDKNGQECITRIYKSGINNLPAEAGGLSFGQQILNRPRVRV